MSATLCYALRHDKKERCSSYSRGNEPEEIVALLGAGMLDIDTLRRQVSLSGDLDQVRDATLLVSDEITTLGKPQGLLSTLIVAPHETEVRACARWLMPDKSGW